MLIESIFIPEPCELAHGTPLLLSSAGISIGSMLTTRDYLGLYYWSMISSLTYSMLFILAQTNEFNYLGYYMNDSELGCIYIFISGLHFIHVLYGIITLGASSNSLYSPGVPPIDTVPMDMYFIMDYYYWHIVEMVYIYIYIILYYYY
jgi:heme/copper-type cytochrome/quinol oxidase subunit 3|tara:strand:- start:124 stop:567 length:444 start_codon:yes stop_codon:yes gene_type:complete